MKYFLQAESSSKWTSFVGPGGKDTLERKMHKMLHRQLLLSQQPETIQHLKELGIPAPTIQKIISLGLFFRPFQRDFVPPVSGDVHQPTGIWCPRNVFFNYATSTEALWAIRLHPRWLAPVLHRKSHGLYTIGTLIDELERTEPYFMLAEMKKCSHGWQEIQRWMIVPDEWNRATEVG